ncbi:MAG: DUF924 domain-containing protein [Deltaproteobacteria bacterium]|nr:DUF924 domain-containing protein [Deltaproteobacteria bacterium]
MSDEQLDPEQVIEFWFGSIADDGACQPAFIKRWWAKDAVFDREVSTRFAQSIADAEAGRLNAFKQSPEGCLALILLCDQMTRNSRRNQPEMYSADPFAQQTVRHALEQQFDRELRTMQRYFLLMPLMHAESRELQKEGVARFDQLVRDAEPGALEAARGAADYMRKHEVIVARFGRFPHRNEILGRQSTPEEIAFLQEPGSSF